MPQHEKIFCSIFQTDNCVLCSPISYQSEPVVQNIFKQAIPGEDDRTDSRTAVATKLFPDAVRIFGDVRIKLSSLILIYVLHPTANAHAWMSAGRTSERCGASLML